MTSWITAYCSFILLISVEFSATQVVLHSFQPDVAVNVHNTFRRSRGSSNMKLMSWDQGLADETAAYARNCDFNHDLNSKDGENIYAGTPAFNSQTLNTSITLWYDEVNDYDLDLDICAVGKACGHYTQVVWANSHLVGCAAVSCVGLKNFATNPIEGTLVICRYRPPGNFRGQKPYREGSACSECAPGWSECVDGLCSQPLTTQPKTSNTTTTTPVMPPASKTTTVATTTKSSPATTTTVGSVTDPCSDGTRGPGEIFPFEPGCSGFYFQCVRGASLKRPCNIGTAFDVTIDTCNHRNLIPACADSPATPPSSTSGISSTRPTTSTTGTSPTPPSSTTAATSGPASSTTSTTDSTPTPVGGCKAEYLRLLSEYREIMEEYRETFQRWKAATNL